MFHRPPSSSSSHARLHFIGNEQDVVLATDPLQSRQEFSRRGEIAALALDRLDENPRDIPGIDHSPEQFVFNVCQRILGRELGADAARATIRVRIMGMEDTGYQANRTVSAGRTCWQ